VDEQPKRDPAQLERDRAHFRAIGRWKYESHQEALEEHLAKSGSERLIDAFRMMLEGPWFEPRFPGPDNDRPEELYDRARKLGLYRP
jgi:hypothetical protein